MLTARNVSQAAPEREALAGPLTFRAFLAHHLAKEEAGDHSPTLVQFRRRGVVLCGRVVEAAAGDECDFFRVDAGIGEWWVPHGAVRLCSHDGRCRCGDRGGRACATDAGAAPLGNTGTTRGNGA